jgi:L-ascorbate metabolism protein UlaG (beta-lactamase superfamily)
MKALGLTLCCLILAGTAFLLAGAPGRAEKQPTRVRWFGHASFLITSSSGLRLVLDPFDARVGYPLPHPTADIVTVSHEHTDHNATGEVRGRFAVVRGVGPHEAAGVHFTGIGSSHGEGRGPNTVFVFEIDGIRFCHLGDLGTPLSQSQLKEIGRVEVLMIPVGGYFTIDAAEATRIVSQLNPKVVLPMHYRTAATSPGLSMLAPVDAFLRGKPKVERLESNTLALTKEKLPKETTVYVLRYD